MRRCVDRVEFHNLGHQGKETVLVKELQCPIQGERFAVSDAQDHSATAGSEFRQVITREASPDEAAEISATMFMAYGSSYAVKYVYFPERLAEFIKTGTLRFLIALIPEHRVMGHCGLIKRTPTSMIAEVGLAAVRPLFRGHSVFRQLVEHSVELAAAGSMVGLSMHTSIGSKHLPALSRDLGLPTTAVMLDYLPPTEQSPNVRQPPRRETLLLQFALLQSYQDRALYPSPAMEEAVFGVYRRLGIAVSPGYREICCSSTREGRERVVVSQEDSFALTGYLVVRRGISRPCALLATYVAPGQCGGHPHLSGHFTTLHACVWLTAGEARLFTVRHCRRRAHDMRLADLSVS